MVMFFTCLTWVISQRPIFAPFFVTSRNITARLILYLGIITHLLRYHTSNYSVKHLLSKLFFILNAIKNQLFSSLRTKHLQRIPIKLAVIFGCSFHNNIRSGLAVFLKFGIWVICSLILVLLPVWLSMLEEKLPPT